MAKKTSRVVQLVSMAGTGYFYTIRRAIKANQEKYATHSELAARISSRVRSSSTLPWTCATLKLLSAPAHTACTLAAPRRLMLMKHDPRVNAHVLFKEEKVSKAGPGKKGR